MNDVIQPPPPGWYTDPNDATTQRYWDGTRWTENRAPVQAAAPGANAVLTVASPAGGVVQPVAVVPQQRTNGFAVASMVLGILWLYWVGSILALIFGYVAKNQIEESAGTQSGGGMATAGLVLGWVGFGTLMFMLVFALLGLVSFQALTPS